MKRQVDRGRRGSRTKEKKDRERGRSVLSRLIRYLIPGDRNRGRDAPGTIFQEKKSPDEEAYTPKKKRYCGVKVEFPQWRWEE